jgi:molybdopterin synthase sulfur carrier subunit
MCSSTLCAFALHSNNIAIFDFILIWLFERNKFKRNRKQENNMTVAVRIPTPLRKLTAGADEVSIEGATIGNLIDNLEAAHPGMKERLCDENGEIRRFVNVYLNDEDVRFLDGRNTVLKDADEVSIVPAIAGGR